MSIENIINDAWENRKDISPDSDKSIIDAINETIELLDQGKDRVKTTSPQLEPIKVGCLRSLCVVVAMRTLTRVKRLNIIAISRHLEPVCAQSNQTLTANQP